MTVWDEALPGAPRAVLVHGAPGCGTDSFAAQQPLADLFRLEVVGRRTAVGGPGAERDDYAADAEAVGRLLHPGAHLVGHATGGAVAMLAAAEQPDAVRSLTLIEPAALDAARPSLGQLALAEWPKVVVNGVHGGPRPDRRADPDTAPPAVCGESVAETIGARHVRVDGTGHYPHREHPEAVNAVLRRLWQS
ncbi:hypothetical protein [Streptomyces sp. NPDC007100]|uniref:alpha/beta fold hydrolase n=1 Tax=Streptomyces sp. NPDC007100 TaxID=3155602 RepID=UPI0033CB4C3C